MRRSSLFLILAMSAAAPAQNLETVTVLARPVERSVHLPGEFLPFQGVDIHARVTGFVERVEVDRGSEVKKGQLLAVLSAPEMTAQIAEAESKVQAAESLRVEAEAKHLAAQSTLEHLKAAAETPGVVAGNELVLAARAVDAAQALVRSAGSSVKAAQSSVAALRDLQGYLRVTAPFDGVITERFLHPGALVGPTAGGPLLRLEQNNRLRLVVAVPEMDLDGMTRGTRVPFTVPAERGRMFFGTLSRISRSMDPKTRTMPVELDVDNARGLLAPGMYPEVIWSAERARASLLVPPTSVVTTTERTFVVRVRNGKAEWVSVSRGGGSGDLVEVFGDLKAGDVVLKRGTDEVRDGTTIARVGSR